MVDVVLKEDKIGVAATRNAGLDWYYRYAAPSLTQVIFADSDDVFVATQIPQLCDKSELLVMSTQECFLAGTSDQQILMPSRRDVYGDYESTLSHQDFVDYLMRPNTRSEYTSVWGKIYRLDVLKYYRLHFNERMYTFEDVDFNFRYLSRIRSVEFSSRVVYAHISYARREGETFQRVSYRRMFGYLWALRSLKRLMTHLGHPDPRIIYHTAFCYLSIILVRIGFMVNSKADFKRFSALAIRLLRSRVHRLACERYDVESGGGQYVFNLFLSGCSLCLVLGAILKGKLRYGF
ncbi:hypothetical protein EB093_09725 [bacterium]|nr:hypothetical protein [bacterium]